MTNKFSEVLFKASQSVLESGYFKDSSVLVDFKSVTYWPEMLMLTQKEITILSSIADEFGFHWYVSTSSDRIYFRMYVPNLIGVHE